ncbi:tRNA-Thr(GGU) m(6)t(6)A37 methyltransferase TsaA [Desulfocicer vacuolatum DSM 3385]|uniref:tRNA-Thr(GGU) m(6)t(6)A37 methyltransferase TsaA n=1 Tax=Desulfocicer vacuolatum DSM 3385 TaxID=1121400 RepID=A0A1W2EG27_9BACT|nr:tRNA (N6-threonylcarbamoyladenosine(37)-N6)-methyltransferase TrmO [Desulfocicer vacuolatum]SMD08286.1 tRNA-Thr(GGU) m(6)t(6)A37 methyltransferase TsaA [Desulfocicer vacuolatum DSM 3385]
MSDTTSTTDIDFSLTPVGHVENTISEMTFSPHGEDTPEERKRQVEKHREETRNTVSTLNILPRFEELLDGIEDFSHIVVIYWPHKLSPEDRQIKKVHPMGRKDIPLKGIFSTRSPARPNPLLISTVRLLKRDKNQLRVKGLEALNGSPIMDIKPTTKHFDGGEDQTFPDWIKELNQDMTDKK